MSWHTTTCPTDTAASTICPTDTAASAHRARADERPEAAVADAGRLGPEAMDAPFPTEPVPRHLAVLLDGNRRWARRHRRPVIEAYQTGATRVHDLMTWCEDVGIAFVTVWALSQDNLHRGSAAVDEIVRTVTARLRVMAAGLRWRIRIIGELDRLPAHRAAALRAVEQQTHGVRGVTLNVAIAYNGRSDIVDAARALLRHQAGRESDGAVTAHRLAQYLSTAGQPDVDLVIRTSGEQRLSGFMPWQTAEAELYFTPTPWPDFDRDCFDQALSWYASRDRRFGR